MLNDTLVDLFPGAREQVYMDTAARGLLPTTARDAVCDLMGQLSDGSADKAVLFDTVERARSGFAELIGATADEIAITKNISEGLCIIAGALPWQAGDNIVFCSDLEHPNNIYPWLNLRDRLGIELRDLPAEDGALPVEAMARMIDDRTRLVPISHVSFAPGFATDFEVLGNACRAHDAFLLVDGAQSAGILHLDMSGMPIDGMAVSTQKGLLGLYGFGFLYCRAAWAEKLKPQSLVRFGVHLGDGGEAAKDLNSYELMPAARRFDLGNYNYPGAMAIAASLPILAGIGTRRIEAHVTQLADRLAGGLAQRGLPVNRDPLARRSSIVTVGAIGGSGHDKTDDAALSALADKLNAAQVRFSIRQGALRFALHIYNGEEDVARVLAVCDEA